MNIREPLSGRLARGRGQWLVAISLLLLLALLIAVPGITRAQNYFFQVPEVLLQVFVQTDGSARMAYDITFENLGQPIDIVDIGVPHKDYSISNFSASIDGQPLQDIRPSEYVKPGVEIHLQDAAIPNGQSGTLHVEFTMPDMVFQDVTNRDLASLEVATTWFDGQFTAGTTNLEIAIHLPEGVSPDDVLYQNLPFSDKGMLDDRAVAVWLFNNTSFSSPHEVALSFPKSAVTNVVEMSLLDLVVDWYTNSQMARVLSGIIALGLVTLIYFRITGATGLTFWFMICAFLTLMFLGRPTSSVVLALVLAPVAYVVNKTFQKRRQRKYMPAIAQVEGGGIKRGLTAPEAAALLELPINKVLTLMVFGLLKKGALEQVTASPLQVRVPASFQAVDATSTSNQRKKKRTAAAGDAGIALHPYELRLLDLIEKEGDKPLKEMDFAPTMKPFLEDLAKRMKGFDLSDTVDYYQAIVKKAVEQAGAIEEIPAREQALDKDMEWILMDEGGPDVFTTPTYSYRPIWIRTGSSSGGASLPSPSSGGSTSAPSFGDVRAASPAGPRTPPAAWLPLSHLAIWAQPAVA